jgi:hypothetical protein
MKTKFNVSGTATYNFTVEVLASSMDDAFNIVDRHPAFDVEGMQLSEIVITDIGAVK